jgi:hypothetical protein
VTISPVSTAVPTAVRSNDASVAATATPVASIAATQLPSASLSTTVVPVVPGSGGNQNTNSAKGGTLPGAAIGGIVGGIVAVAAALIAFVLMKRRKKEEAVEDIEQEASDTIETDSDFGRDDPVYVSEYGLSDKQNDDVGADPDAGGDFDSGNAASDGEDFLE